MTEYYSGPIHPGTAQRMGVLIGRVLQRDGVSQADFARLVGVSQKHLSRVVTGQCAANPATLDRWAAILGCSFTVGLDQL